MLIITMYTVDGSHVALRGSIRRFFIELLNIVCGCVSFIRTQ